MSIRNVSAASRCQDDSALIAVAGDRAAGVRWSRKVALDIVAMADVAAIVISAFLPVAIYAIYGGITPNVVLAVQSSMAAAIIVVLLLSSWGMYDPNRVHDLPQNPEKLLAALGVTFVAVMGLGLPHAIKDAHLWIWYATWGTAAYTLMLANRDVSGFVLRKLTEQGRFNKRVAVFGAGQIARRVRDQLSDPALGITFVGVFDDRMGDGRLNPEGLSVAGRLSDLVEAARDERIDQIIIALPAVAESRMSLITKQLEQLPVSVHIVTHIASDFVERESTHKVSSLGDVGLLDVKKKALSDWAPLVKRFEDVVLGSVFCALTAVVAPFIALAIKLDSPGPVLFRQSRRGLNKLEFDVLKFRTMYVSNEETNTRQASKGDPRVTRVGWYLRRFSLDELPQIINVMKGEMSLVGPRPHAIAHDDEFSLSLERYANRHQVKPGITGLAQVHGWRGETDTIEKLETRISYDITYIKTWSLSLDLWILMRTAWVVVSGKNAY